MTPDDKNTIKHVASALGVIVAAGIVLLVGLWIAVKTLMWIFLR